MKILFVLLSITSFSLSASESIVCLNDNLKLKIQVDDVVSSKNVSWTISVLNNIDVSISGSGVWQKENDNADAFSSYDAISAISYKNKRAVFVMGNDQSIYFQKCTIAEDL
jgi:hypothetical protein